MLILLEYNLAYLAMTKTGSTAIEAALSPLAEIALSSPPRLKHMQYRRFARVMAPMLAEIHPHPVETLAMIRHPVDWLGSWYRYRQRPNLPAPQNSTAEISFDAFVTAYLSDAPPDFARVGRPSAFVAAKDGTCGIDRLFRYDAWPAFAAFLENRLDTPLSFDRRNVSPPGRLTLDPGIRKDLEQAAQADFDLYESARR